MNLRTAAVRPAALLYMVGGWVGGSVRRVLYVLLLLQYCCCGTAVTWHIPTLNSTCGEHQKGPVPAGDRKSVTMQQRPLHERAHVLLLYVLLRLSLIHI